MCKSRALGVSPSLCQGLCCPRLAFSIPSVPVLPPYPRPWPHVLPLIPPRSGPRSSPLARPSSPSLSPHSLPPLLTGWKEPHLLRWRTGPVEEVPELTGQGAGRAGLADNGVSRNHDRSERVGGTAVIQGAWNQGMRRVQKGMGVTACVTYQANRVAFGRQRGARGWQLQERAWRLPSPLHPRGTITQLTRKIKKTEYKSSEA